MLDWKAGDQVIGIADELDGSRQTFWNGNYVIVPLKGCVYTIREILVLPDIVAWQPGEPTILVKEIVNNKFYCEDGIPREPSWYAFMFRKVKPVDIGDLLKLQTGGNRARKMEYIE